MNNESLFIISKIKDVTLCVKVFFCFSKFLQMLFANAAAEAQISGRPDG